MTDVLKMSRKALTVGIVLTTILWSMMATALVAPLKASAAGCTSNTLIKGSLSAVYYCGADGKRYVFTNDKAYFTWYPSFSGVMTISDADLATIQIGGNVTYRPGVKMIKIQTDPKTYAVSKNGTLRWVTSEALAVCLYGSTWNKQIDDVSDAFFTNYSIGAPINACSDYDKNAEMSASQNINQDKNIGGSTSSGAVNASLASDNPASATVPSGATSVNMLKFVLANNSSSAVTIDSLMLKRVGPGTAADFGNIYLYEGPARLTTGRSINSSTNEVNFTGLNLMLNAGTSRTLWVAANIAANPGAGDVSAFQLIGGSAGSAVLGGLPVQGSNFTMASATVGSLTISKTGSITDPKVGQKNVKIAEFQIAAGSAEDVWLNRVTLFQGGNLAGANLTNLLLKQAGNTVATAGGFDTKLHAVFNLAAPMKLEKGATKTFEVYGDVGGSARSGDTLKLYVEEDTDVYGTGATFGYGVTVVRTTYDGDACTSSAGDCSFSTVQGGQVTVAFNGPSSSNIASNGKDVELFNFSLTSQGNVEVRNLRLQVDCGPATTLGGCYSNAGLTTPNYTDIKVTNTATGQVWWGPKDLSGGTDTSVSLVFNDVQNLTAGTSYTFKVTADVASTVPDADTVMVTFVAFTGSDLRNLDNSTFVSTSDIVPSGNIAGNPQTVHAPGLEIGIASVPQSMVHVKGSTGVEMLGINMGASSGGGNVRLNSMTLRVFVDADGAGDFQQGQDTDGSGTVSSTDDLLSCMLLDAATGLQVGESKSPTTSTANGNGGLLQFTNLNWTIDEVGATALVLCDVSNSAFKNGDTERLSVDLTVDTDVSAQDMDGDSLTALAAYPINGGTTPVVFQTITDTGSLTFQAAPTDTESEASLVVAGASNVVLAKYRLTAQSEELKLVKIKAYVTTAAQDSVTSVSLYDGSTLVAGPVALTTETASATAQFSGMNFIIPKDGSKTLTLKATLNTISNGADMGDDLKAWLHIPGTAGTDTSSMEARGTSSSTVIRQLAGAGQELAGNSKLLRKTKPTVSLASLPTTVLVNGGGVVAYRFTVTADAAENVSLKKVSFKASISPAGGVISSASIREVNQGSDIAATGTVAIAGSNCGFTATATENCVRVVFDSEQTVTAGTSKTFELRLTTSGFVSNDSLSTTLLGDTTAVAAALSGTAPAVGAGAEHNFVWSDNSAIPHNDTIGGSADWTNGFLVKVRPGDAQTLSMN